MRYRVEHIRKLKDVEARLNDLAADGWTVVAVLPPQALGTAAYGMDFLLQQEVRDA